MKESKKHYFWALAAYTFLLIISYKMFMAQPLYDVNGYYAPGGVLTRFLLGFLVLAAFVMLIGWLTKHEVHRS